MLFKSFAQRHAIRISKPDGDDGRASSVMRGGGRVLG